MQFSILSLTLLSLFKLATADDYDATTVVTTTPHTTEVTTFVAQEDIYGTVYIYTNDDGQLTTQTVLNTQTNSYDPATTTTSSSSSSASSSTTASSYSLYNDPVSETDTTTSEPTLVIPVGDYTTSTKISTTTLDNGNTAIVELVVLYTSDC
ncbi:uncharacterized protein SPAPADRAFT_61362 [Spathaspora passalidarum NRRL Y-27907]|uniref:Uncharacterized protein n=1 Tax=Spathaspora passalidarum (strain NRRL Y-27907 / 11-Y1) TaxID=619300 RepID=G3APV4_SPAPN|nr:uncharacterized protein SPAPADRAFT_61362 [Spathaspora passalidarum NRRL Y-27907]EGW32275.1 hypothetical protein SPAPADRAFT_61362 [Spathaspora passalidarum NRRL Y-27907]